MKMSTCASVALIFSSATLIGSAAHAEPGQPEIVAAPVEQVFVPFGFDSNDNVEVIVHGNFVNSCFKVGPAKGSVDYATSTITVEASSYFYPASECAKIVVPFEQSVSLGIVHPGTYRVVVKDVPAATVTDLVIAEATSDEADDFLYAPVVQSSLTTGADGRSVVRIEGSYPYTFVGCMSVKEVRIHLTPGHVLVVQPIAELLTGGPICDAQNGSKAFTIDTPIQDRLESGDFLVHVRALSGRSVNRVVVLQGR